MAFREHAAKCKCGADFLVTHDHRGPKCRECRRLTRMEERKARRKNRAKGQQEAKPSTGAKDAA